jgi:CRP-like cAMP-binding protein
VGDRFYIITAGKAVVSKRDEAGVEKLVTHLHPGQYFGEMALIYDNARVATVLAKVPPLLLLEFYY